MSIVEKHAKNRLVYLIVVFMILAIYTMPIPGNSILMSAIQNAGHWLLFFALTLASFLLYVCSGQSWRTALFVIPPVLMILGVAGEVLQIPLQRDADWSDIAGNAQGVISGIFTFAFGVFAHRRRFLAAGFCLLVVLVFTTINLREPVSQAIASFTSPTLPIVADFDNLGALLRVRAIHGADISLVHADYAFLETPSIALGMVLSDRRFSGVELLEIHRNWSNYARLVTQIVNTGTEIVKLGIRISDRRDDISVMDGYHEVLELQPGPNVISVELQTAAQLATRKMDLNNMHRLSFYALTGEHYDQALILDDVVLE